MNLQITGLRIDSKPGKSAAMVKSTGEKEVEKAVPVKKVRKPSGNNLAG